MQKRTLSAEELSQIRILVEQSASLRDISKIIGTSIFIIRRETANTDIVFPTIEQYKKLEFTSEQSRDILNRIRGGSSIRKVIEDTGFHRLAIERVLVQARLTVDDVRKTWKNPLAIVLSFEQLTKIKKLFANKVSLAQTAKIMGVSKKIIDRTYKELGLTPTRNKKVILTAAQLTQIQTLFDQGLGQRTIAKKMGLTRTIIKNGYDELGINAVGRHPPRTVYLYTEKYCKVCQQTKPIDQFRKRITGDRISYESYCQDCTRAYNNEKGKARAKELRRTSPEYRLRCSVSYFIWYTLKAAHSSKHGHSCMEFLPWTIIELKKWLEEHFEPWMTWNNYGQYSAKTWDDNDPTTWTWQLDHIIPQSDLPYDSMEHPNFQKCWSLENLRPLSAKRNNLEGVRRVRHDVKPVLGTKSF